MTTEQIEKIKYRLEVLEYMNSSVTHPYKFKDVKMYQDDLGNLFLYYVSINEVDKTPTYMYVEYDFAGNETVLNKDEGFTIEELKTMFLSLKPFEL